MSRQKNKMNMFLLRRSISQPRWAKKKKAVSPWIAWVLLVAFAASLSAFMYRFMVDYTNDSTDAVKEQTFNTDECRSVSLSIESICQTSQVLNITIQNRNYIKINKLTYRLFDAGNKPISSNETDTTMNPNRKKQVSLGIGQTLGYIEIVPHVVRENIEIICDERKASTSNIPSC